LNAKEIQNNRGLFVILGFIWETKNPPKANEIKLFLINLGFYEEDLKNCPAEVQEDIISYNLNKVGNSLSFYFNFSSYKISNKKILLKSNTFRNIFPKNLDEVNHNFMQQNQYLWSLLEIDYSNQVLNLRIALIKLDLFSSDLRDYSEVEANNIIENILKKQGTFISYYLTDSIFVDFNKKVLKYSFKFKEFLEKESKKRVQNFLKKYNFSESILEEKIKFSVLQTIWRDEEINYLIQLYEKNPDTLINRIKLTDLARKEFGRSKDAILGKLNSLINESISSKGTKSEINSRGVSSFPKEIEQYFNELVNYSELHSQNSMLEEFPVLSYTYPYNRTLTDESCYVLIIPFEFKGNSLNKYKSFEQHIISRLYSKLIDINSDELVETNKLLEIKLDQNFISNFFSEKTSLVGLYIRKKFSLNQKIQTCEIPEEIDFENGSKKIKYWIFNES
jgi:hypothetical protein